MTLKYRTFEGKNRTLGGGGVGGLKMVANCQTSFMDVPLAKYLFLLMYGALRVKIDFT